MELDNREIASLLWLGLAATWILSKRELRSGLRDIAGGLAQPAIASSLSAMCAYIVGLVKVATAIGLWDTSLLKATVVWAFGSGFVAFFNSTQAAFDSAFFRRLAISTIGITAFVEFFVNLYVLSLPAEIFLQFVIIVLSLMVAVARTKPEHRKTKILCEILLAGIGVALLHYTVREAYGTWADADLRQMGLDFVVPIWLTLGFLPFVYGVSLYAGYDSAFRGINRATQNPRTRWRARLALAVVLTVRARKLNRFGWNWAERLAQASSHTEARAIVQEFLRETR